MDNVYDICLTADTGRKKMIRPFLRYPAMIACLVLGRQTKLKTSPRYLRVLMPDLSSKRAQQTEVSARFHSLLLPSRLLWLALVILGRGSDRFWLLGISCALVVSGLGTAATHD